MGQLCTKCNSDISENNAHVTIVPKVINYKLYNDTIYKVDYIRVFDQSTIVIKTNYPHNLCKMFQLDDIDYIKYSILSHIDKIIITSYIRSILSQYYKGIYVGFTGNPPFEEYNNNNNIVIYYINEHDMDISKSSHHIHEVDMCININELIANYIAINFRKLSNKYIKN